MALIFLYLIVSFISYLVGSIPFGLVLTRLAGLGDIRKIGSGNIGATNVLRTGHKGLALATLLLDSGKGGIMVMITGLFFPHSLALLAGFSAIIGHNFSIWLKFKGGKGVATSFGVLLACNKLCGISVCLVWLVTALVFRYSSLAALVAFMVAPIFSLIFGTKLEFLLALSLSLLGYWQHRHNIIRLIHGSESKIGSMSL